MGAILSRRSLLKGSVAVLPGLALLNSGRPAHAFSTETMSPGSSLGLAYSNRCGGDSMHEVVRQLTSDFNNMLAKERKERIEAERAAAVAQEKANRLEADLASQTGPVGTTLSETVVCPICGCPITVTRVVR